VQNWLDEPSIWQYNTSRIASSNGVLTWNNGIVFDDSDGYIYLIGDQSNTFTTVLARITETDLTSFNWKGMEFWSGSAKGWLIGDSSSLVGLFPGKYNEGTLIFNEYLREWYVISLQAGENFIWLSHSPTLTGSWTSVPVYRIPNGWTKSPFISYAAKAHPEYASDDSQIIITYNTNRNDGLGPMVSDIAIYHPYFVQLQIIL